MTFSLKKKKKNPIQDLQPQIFHSGTINNDVCVSLSSLNLILIPLREFTWKWAGVLVVGVFCFKRHSNFPLLPNATNAMEGEEPGY